MTSNNHKASQLARKTAELSFAAPQVVAHRVSRMATAGLNPSKADRKEFTMMGAEKVAAFYESWQAMGWQMLQAQQQMWMKMFMNPMMWWQPWNNKAFNSQMQRSMLDVMGKGLFPVHSRAVSNAKRLGRSTRR